MAHRWLREATSKLRYEADVAVYPRSACSKEMSNGTFEVSEGAEALLVDLL